MTSRTPRSRERRRKNNMLAPWSETVGRVEEVGEDYVILSFSRKCIVRTRQGEPARWMLKRGSKVAILLLDNGSIRVRGLDAHHILRTKGEASSRSDQFLGRVKLDT